MAAFPKETVRSLFLVLYAWRVDIWQFLYVLTSKVSLLLGPIQSHQNTKKHQQMQNPRCPKSLYRLSPLGFAILFFLNVVSVCWFLVFFPFWCWWDWMGPKKKEAVEG
jgi:hypothetical protein